MLFSTLNKQKLEFAGILLELKARQLMKVSEEKIKEIAEGAKAGCIISKALSVPITMNVSYS